MSPETACTSDSASMADCVHYKYKYYIALHCSTVYRSHGV